MDRLEELKKRLAAKKASVPAPPAQPVASTEQSTTQTPPPLAMLAPLLPPPSYRPDSNVPPTYHDPHPLTHQTATSFVNSYLAGDRSHGPKGVGYVVLGADTSRRLVDIDSAYESKGTLGSGVYGTVYAGAAITTDGTTQPMRALKQIKGEWLSQSQVGVPAYLLREFDVVMRLRHPNIVRGLDMGHAKEDATGSTSVYLVSDHGGTNLKSFLYAREAYLHLGSRNAHPLAAQALQSKLKCVCKQLLTGLAYLHSHCVVHRDLKTSNLLVDTEGVVRICDFGLARFLKEGALLTPGVCTLMYRAPELHFGIHDYGTKIDIWSAACVMAELFLKAPLFPSDTEAQHFQAVCDVMGIPDDKADFKGLYHLGHAVAMLRGLQPKQGVGCGVKAAFDRSSMRGAKECADEDFMDMLQSMLKWNPADRPTAEALLEHRWFRTNPLPCSPTELLWPLPFSKGEGASPTHAPIAAPVASPLSLGKKRDRTEEGTPTRGGSTPEGADADEACAGANTADTPKVDQDEKRRLMAHYQDESAEPPTAGDFISDSAT